MDFSSTNERLAIPPKPRDFELTLFGPGVGECILMHLGNGDWFVVDSCVFPDCKQPVALRYLHALGIDPKNAVCRILATHWHDDHIRGLHDVLKRCPDAVFVMSAALQTDQFAELVYEAAEVNKFVAASSTATEFANILDLLGSRSGGARAPNLFASDSSMLYQGGDNNAVRVQALSPSAQTIADTLKTIASVICTSPENRRFRSLTPNHLSVALQVSAGAVDLLLKADLENTSEPHRGWKAVLSSQLRPQRKSGIVKVGHHGSQNADNHEVWLDMVMANPLCVVAPYSRLEEPLPTRADLERIASRTDQCYVTTWPPSTRVKGRPEVDRWLDGATKVRRGLARDPGFVRVRFDMDAVAPVPSVELFGSACKNPSMRG